jgi:hypothetical protein
LWHCSLYKELQVSLLQLELLLSCSSLMIFYENKQLWRYLSFFYMDLCLVRIWAFLVGLDYDFWADRWSLQGERKISVLVGISLAFMVHVVAVYWWYQNDDLLYPLIMLPPKSIPPFWHAIFIIMVNGMFTVCKLLTLSLLLIDWRCTLFKKKIFNDGTWSNCMHC